MSVPTDDKRLEFVVCAKGRPGEVVAAAHQFVHEAALIGPMHVGHGETVARIRATYPEMQRWMGNTRELDAPFPIGTLLHFTEPLYPRLTGDRA